MLSERIRSEQERLCENAGRLAAHAHLGHDAGTERYARLYARRSLLDIRDSHYKSDEWLALDESGKYIMSGWSKYRAHECVTER